ncbi:MAG: cobalt-precorrin-6A reductase [Janthinobacterium lividum]
MLRVLVLGGSTEAGALVRALRNDARFDTTLSLAGVTRAPLIDVGIATRIGGFGGADGLAEWLRTHAIDALVDATHPFAQQISRNAVLACAVTSMPMLRVARPEWRPVPGDRWNMVADMHEAAVSLGPAPRCVLLTIGRKDLAQFRDQQQHDYVVRSVDAPPPELLPLRCHLVTARGPFDPDAELALLRDFGIEVIVTKNSGGQATDAKLDAARRLGLAVVMIARPAPVEGPAVPDWQSALSWLNERHQASDTLRAV